jgi:hypothetical protein
MEKLGEGEESLEKTWGRRRMQKSGEEEEENFGIKKKGQTWGRIRGKSKRG